MFGWLTIARNPDVPKYRLYKAVHGITGSMFETSSKSALRIYLEMSGLVLNFGKSRTMFEIDYFTGTKTSTGCIQVDESKE